MITVNESAATQVRKILNEEGMPDNSFVRVGVKGGGCSGFQYVWDFQKNWPDVEWSAPIEDVLVLDPVAEMYVIGSEIDYVTELGGSFLTVKNPTAASSCGCGESFGI